MTIRFTKMHGLGNDFIVINAMTHAMTFSTETIKDLARRDTGIGFDQCLVVEAPKQSKHDFFYRIFNADGQEVGQCGNGARCLARFVSHYGLTTKKIISVATCTTEMQLRINEDETVTVDFGRPRLRPSEIPFNFEQQASLYPLILPGGLQVKIHAINVGNPHAVTLVDDLSQTAVTSLGKDISEHFLFPEQSNAGFMKILDNDRLLLRVYERGSGETKACGSGAVAAAALGRLYYQMASRIKVSLPGGDLIVDWPDLQNSIYLTGPASFVYEGALMSCE